MEESEIKRIIKEVSKSMEKKGYNSITQLVGYLISNDIGYIPDFDDNRNKMATLDRTLILENMYEDAYSLLTDILTKDPNYEDARILLEDIQNGVENPIVAKYREMLKIKKEMQIRRELNYPPYYNLLLIKLSGKNEDYELFEIAPENLENGFSTASERYNGLNVTIPHKIEVMQYIFLLSVHLYL